MAWMKQKAEVASFGPTGTRPASPRGNSTPTFQREVQSSPALVNIGKTVTIKGEVTGDEDLIIEGNVEGSISLPGHLVSIGERSQIHGDIHAKSVVVNGRVLGNITASGKVQIGATGSMKGDIRAGQIALLDGARFKGNVDMESAPATRRDSPVRPASAAGQGENRGHSSQVEIASSQSS